MATVAVTPLIPNDSIAAPTGITSTATNTVGTAEAPPPPLEELILRVVVSTATTAVTIKAGDYPPALSSGQGDHSESLAVGVHYMGPFTSARFLQSDGTMHVDVATPANVDLAAMHLPRTA